ncbi:MAG TPA: SpoIIE family protein phosphatase [Candidatus Nitrosotenuis sp.]|nr:SpoIIE family protein phosphatase [Candidatus Nitrosotenuis sp.]
MDLHKPDWLQQMEGIFESLYAGVMVIDDCGIIVSCNENLAELSGYELPDILGRTPAHFYQGEDLEFINKKIAEGEQLGRHRYEFHVPHKSGRMIPVIISTKVVEDPDGRTFAVVTFTDITEQKIAEARLRDANAQLERRAREIEAELQLASRVQQSLAPRSLRWGRAAVEAHYLPVRTIGGDFGLVAPLGDGHLNLLVCDVSGHGISSALMANRIYTETLSLFDRGVDVGDTLRQLNRFVVQQIRVGGFYFTMALARLSDHGHRMHFAAGGHPPALWTTPAGEVRRLGARATILGMLEDAVPDDVAEEIPLTRGERIFLYTDGLTEVWNPQGEMLGTDGLEEIVRRAAGQPLADVKNFVLGEVDAFRHGPATDDVSLVILEVL